MNNSVSDRTIRVLTLIAEGHSYAQTVETIEGLTYPELFSCAGEALDAITTRQRQQISSQSKYPRAYEPWKQEEDDELSQLIQDGATSHSIAAHLGRKPSAIRSRLVKLGLQR